MFPSALQPQQPVDLRKPWERALARADISDFRWHDLRHTSASYMAMAGCSLVEIAEILGHRTLQMVRRYSHFNRDHLSNVANKLAARLDTGKAG